MVSFSAVVESGPRHLPGADEPGENGGKDPSGDIRTDPVPEIYHLSRQQGILRGHYMLQLKHGQPVVRPLIWSVSGQPFHMISL